MKLDLHTVLALNMESRTVWAAKTELSTVKVVTTASRGSGSGVNSFQEMFTTEQGSISCFVQTPIIADTMENGEYFEKMADNQCKSSWAVAMATALDQWRWQQRSEQYRDRKQQWNNSTGGDGDSDSKWQPQQ